MFRAKEIDYSKGVKPIREGLFTIPGAGSTEKPMLIGSKCKLCDHKFFPQRHICPYCFRDDVLEPVFLSRKGKLYSYCTVQTPPPGFDEPYVIGHVDIEDGLKIFSQITDCEFSEVRPGMELELTLRRLAEDEEKNQIVCYMFKPI